MNVLKLLRNKVLKDRVQLIGKIATKPVYTLNRKIIICIMLANILNVGSNPTLNVVLSVIGLFSIFTY